MMGKQPIMDCYVMLIIRMTKGLSYSLLLNPLHFLEDAQVEHLFSARYILREQT